MYQEADTESSGDTQVSLAVSEEANVGYVKPEHPEIESVNELHFDRFAIPDYQRPYKWTSKNVNQLIDDILCFKDCSEYRLGTLVLHSGTPRNKQLNIVDGQQRVITISLLLYQLMREETFSRLLTSSMRHPN